MSWLYLIIAGLLEVAWAVGLKYSEGFSKLIPSIVTIICMLVGFTFLSLSVRSLPLGTAYAVWTGIGTVGTAIYGIMFFNEPRDFIRLACIFIIIIGIIGLKLTNK